MVTSCSTDNYSIESDEKLYSFPMEEILIGPQTNTYVCIFPAKDDIFEERKLHNLTPQETVLWFRNEGLPISIVADMMRVERKTVYSWMKGTPLRIPNQERLEKLYILISDNRQTNLIHLYRFWNRRLANDSSLGDLLKEENLNDEAIKKALVELWPLALKAQKVTDANNKDKDNPFLEEIGEIVITDDR